MFRRNSRGRDRSAAALEARYGSSPALDAYAHDDSLCQRQLIPSLEVPAVYPNSALEFLAWGAIHLEREGVPNDVGWPFAGTPEEYLQSQGLEV